MSRWQPDARERLEKAAFELFADDAEIPAMVAKLMAEGTGVRHSDDAARADDDSKPTRPTGRSGRATR